MSAPAKETEWQRRQRRTRERDAHVAEHGPACQICGNVPKRGLDADHDRFAMCGDPICADHGCRHVYRQKPTPEPLIQPVTCETHGHVLSGVGTGTGPSDTVWNQTCDRCGERVLAPAEPPERTET